MKREMSMVRAFHERHSFAVDKPFGPVSPDGLNYVVGRMADRLVADAAKIAGCHSLAGQRASLVLEEAGETAQALVAGDVVALADGLADLVYVAIGTAVAYGIPLDRVFDEVHRSNMTKPLRAGDLHPPKLDGYDPPRVKEVLDGTL